MDYELEDYWNTLPPPTIVDASQFVDFQRLGQIRINLPFNRNERFIIAYVINAFHGSKDGPKFVPDNVNGKIILNTWYMYWGCTYQVRVIGREYPRIIGGKPGKLVENVQFEVRSQRSKTKLELHLANIERAVYKGAGAMKEATFYRNVTSSDLDAGILQPTQRTRSGHPYKIAFNRFPTLYFCVRLENGNLPSTSPYSPYQLSYPPDCIIKPESRLFLADIHCYYETPDANHYIILVLATEGQPACSELRSLGAKELDISNNHFLTYNSDTKVLKAADRLRFMNYEPEQNSKFHHKIWTEVMVADQTLSVSDADFRTVSYKPKDRYPRVNAECDICNAFKEYDERMFAEEDLPNNSLP